MFIDSVHSIIIIVFFFRVGFVYNRNELNDDEEEEGSNCSKEYNW